MQLIDDALELSGSQVLNAKRYREVLWHRRCMAMATALTVGGIFAYIFAIISPNWAIINFTNLEHEFVDVHLGVWGEWRTTTNGTRKSARWIPHFPRLPSDVPRLCDTDLKPLNGPESRSAVFEASGKTTKLNYYYRTQMAFSIIALILMVSNNALAVYTFYHHRFIYKRLVACLHIVIAMCIVVTIEVLTNSVNEWNVSVAQQSKNITWDYSVDEKAGHSTYVAWGCVFVYVLGAIVFALGSHKQKGSRAATAEFEIEDRPVHIGR